MPSVINPSLFNKPVMFKNIYIIFSKTIHHINIDYIDLFYNVIYITEMSLIVRLTITFVFVIIKGVNVELRYYMSNSS